MVSSLKLLKNKQFQVKTDTYILKASPQLQLWKVILRLIFGLCLSHRCQEWLFWSFSCVFFRRKTIHAIASKYIQHLTWIEIVFFFFDQQNIAWRQQPCILYVPLIKVPRVYPVYLKWVFLDFLRLSKTRICKENNNQNKTNQCSQSLFHTSLIQKHFLTKNYKINRNLILLINFLFNNTKYDMKIW